MLKRAFRGSESVRMAISVTVFALSLVVAGQASAFTVSGGGNARNDCYATFDVTGITSATANKQFTCTDGDPACDFDGECNDSCTFQVAVCANTSGIAGCTPGSLTKLTETGPKPKRVGFALPPLTGSACGAFSNVVVPVKVKRNGTKKDGKRKFSVVAKGSTRPKTDADKATATCQPRVGECPPQGPEAIGRLTFTFTPGTTSCGGANGLSGFTPPGEPPFSGALYDAVDGGGNKVADLGAGCLFFGGASGVAVPPGPIPSGGTAVFDVTGDPANLSSVQLVASDGDGRGNCTKGPATTKHCLNNTTIACTTNDDCNAAGAANPCNPDANCYFGPPLIIYNSTTPALSTCVVNAVAGDVAGTGDLTTGNVNLTSYSLTSSVYLTGEAYDGQPCPKCVNSVCNGGARAGQACTPTGPAGTTLDCFPDESTFLGPLAVNLAPLSTTQTVKSAADGVFCPQKFCKSGFGPCNQDSDCLSGTCVPQENPGAFGLSTPRSIVENGSAAGNLTDNQPHDATLAYVFCIPPPGEPASSSADLPGPGAVSLPGTLQFTPAAQ